MSDPGFRRSYDVIAILFIGYFMYHFARIWIDLKIKEEGGETIEVAPGDEGYEIHTFPAMLHPCCMALSRCSPLSMTIGPGLP